MQDTPSIPDRAGRKIRRADRMDMLRHIAEWYHRRHGEWDYSATWYAHRLGLKPSHYVREMLQQGVSEGWLRPHTYPYQKGCVKTVTYYEFIPLSRRIANCMRGENEG